ncbi:MAG: hypothetical protein ABJA81_05150, partial [Nocardioidaceae bacterium]
CRPDDPGLVASSGLTTPATTSAQGRVTVRRRLRISGAAFGSLALLPRPTTSRIARHATPAVLDKLSRHGPTTCQFGPHLVRRFKVGPTRCPGIPRAR